MAQHVLVLNATYEPLNVCTVRRACVLLLKEKAELVETMAVPLRTSSSTFPHPTVIRLVSFVKAPRFAARRITRRAVFARDGYRCQYCGGGPSRLTVDHVVPRSRGGGSSWDNIVTSCAPCNVRKGDRLPHEVGMTPRIHPRPPAPSLFLTLSVPEVHPAWELYLAPRGRKAATAAVPA